MNLYSDQMAGRIRSDQDALESSFVKLSSVVMGHRRQAETFLSDRDAARNAIEEILKYYHIAAELPPEDITSVDEQLEYFLHPSGVMRRAVELSGKWYKDGISPLLGQTAKGQVIALIPGRASGYTYFDYETNRRVRVTARNAGEISPDAYCFYNPLPTKKIKVSDLILYMTRSLALSDYIVVIAAVLASVAIGLVLPYANRQIFENVIPSGETARLMSIAVLMAGAAISAVLIRVTQNVAQARITTKTEMAVQSACMARMLSLPASFFKDYSSGEVAQRMQSLSSLCGVLIKIFFGTGLTGLFSFIYIGQVAVMVPALAGPAMAVVLINVAITTLNALISVRILRKRMEQEAKLNGVVFSLISGIQKIKVSGSERRAFSKWADKYAVNARLIFTPPVFTRIAAVLVSAVSMAGTIIIFSIASSSGVSVAEYMGFSASYGLVSGSVLQLAGIAAVIASVKPILDMAKPFMEAPPEVSQGKKVVNRLSGNIEISNVSFRYGEDDPIVLDDLSLKITKGQYVAIVGASGCGKSTLIRILLGFEKPQKGAVYYDSADMKALDLKSLRKSIGCVVQNGTLMNGSVFDNITAAAPWLSVKDAWEAAEGAAVADDIRAMPMGMYTLISDGGGGVSGGQKQRLLIARALAAKPKILLLDEATSALDNITQKQVARSLDKSKCTRVVIAHRLSTIRQCDRIIMLEKGKIAEDGTYGELMALKGKFADLVERQRMEG